MLGELFVKLWSLHCEMHCIFSTQWTRSVCICVCVVLVNLDVLCKVTVDIAKDYMHFYH